MGKNTKIEWTATPLPDGTSLPGYTANFWRGCTKVSAGCKNCYADSLSARNPKVLGVWGPKGTRVIASESYWNQPIAWNAEAGKNGVRRKVFCASLADVFEGRDTMPEASWEPVRAARQRLFALIEQTPNLDWLLLTKRPENIASMVPAKWDQEQYPANVWIGTSVEDQKTADERIPHLLKIPASVRFLSCEPLLGPVDIEWALNNRACMNGSDWENVDGVECECRAAPDYEWKYAALLSAAKNLDEQLLHWIIVGGESGSQARPMHPDWARSLRNQCEAAGVPYFFKQWGEYSPVEPEHFPSIVKIQGEDIVGMARIGKKAAGRLLDGRTWDELPEITP